MPRPRRHTPGGYAYHVLNRGVGRMQLFDDTPDYLAFVRILAQALQRHPEARLLSFCIMPNHWHLVFHPKRGADRVLSELMQWTSTTHARRWHMHRHTVGNGPIYQGRFKSFPIQRDEHLLTVLRYVETNALRANLIQTGKAQDWRWGSLWLRQQPDALTEEETDLRGQLADWPIDRPTEQGWLTLVNRPQNPKELQALRRSVARGQPYGSNPWTEQTANRLNLTSTLRRPGRPMKKS